MKMWKKLLTSVFAASVLIGLSTGTVLAAETGEVLEKEAYTYKVTFYSGNQGDITATEEELKEYIVVTDAENVAKEAAISKDADKVVVTGLNAGDKVGITAQAVIKLDETSKYYVQGMRLSGRDNDDVADAAFVVEGDADYVAAYGIKGNQVAYTVHYVDTNGKKLAKSDTFYGNVGDKPVISYKYIKGYAPKSLAQKKTLSENEAENVFKFVYTELPSPTYGVVETVIPGETIVIDGGTTYIGSGTGTETETDGSENASDNRADNEAAGNAEEEAEDPGILDLDEETPLSNLDLDDDEIQKGLPMAAYVGMSIVALLAIIIAVILLKKRSKDAEEAEDEKEE